MKVKAQLHLILVSPRPAKGGERPSFARTDFMVATGPACAEPQEAATPPPVLALFELGQHSLKDAQPALALIRQLRAQHPALGVLVHWPEVNTDGVVAAMRARADEVLLDPPTPRQLLRQLGRLHLHAPQRRALLTELRAATATLHPLLALESALHAASPAGADLPDQLRSKALGRLISGIARERASLREQTQRTAYGERRLQEVEANIDRRIAALAARELELHAREEELRRQGTRIATDIARLRNAEETFRVLELCREELDARERALSRLERAGLSFPPVLPGA